MKFYSGTFKVKNFEKSRYLADLKLLMPFRAEKTQAYAMVVFTIVALSFFGLFAINPTLATIVELRKKLEDSKLVNEELRQKIASMNTLYYQYSDLTPDLPSIYAAVPKDPEGPLLLGQIQSLVEDHKVQIEILELDKVDLSSATPQKANELPTVSFSLDVVGTYADLQNLLSDLTNFDRIITIDEITISRDEGTNESRRLHIGGKAYYQYEKQ